MLPATTASASSSSLSFSTSSLTSSLRRRASSTVFTPAGCTVAEGMALAEGAGVASGIAEGVTLALGAGLGRVSALLAQAENSARPSREITTRVQVFFNAVRLLAAIVCRSGEANVRQLFPVSDDQPCRSRERMRPQMRLVTSPASCIRRGSLSISRRWSILPEMALIK